MVPFLWHAVLRKTASVRSSNKQNILLFYPIVTPYKQQEKFIKNQLVKKGINSGSTIESKNPNDIEVGSVDKYQVIRIHDFWFFFPFSPGSGCILISRDLFQGNEKTVIIYSTVRSIKKQPVQKKFIRSKKDPGKKLDLLKDNFFFDYKRFNVAITRAKSLGKKHNSFNRPIFWGAWNRGIGAMTHWKNLAWFTK